MATAPLMAEHHLGTGIMGEPQASHKHAIRPTVQVNQISRIR